MPLARDAGWRRRVTQPVCDLCRWHTGSHATRLAFSPQLLAGSVWQAAKSEGRLSLAKGNTHAGFHPMSQASLLSTRQSTARRSCMTECRADKLNALRACVSDVRLRQGQVLSNDRDQCGWRECADEAREEACTVFKLNPLTGDQASNWCIGRPVSDSVLITATGFN